MEKNNINILIVEDNPADARLIVEMLKNCSGPSFKVSHAERLDEAFKMLENKGIDVVLLDLDLPDSKGLGGVERITARYPYLPVILLTGVDDENIGIRALQKRASDYLVKGRIDEHLLCRSVRYAIERKSYEDALVREKGNLQKIFDSVNVGMVILDDKGIVRRANETVSKWVGKDTSDCLGDQPGNILRCIHAIAEPKGCGYAPHCGSCPIRNAFESVLRTGKPVHGVESEAFLSVKDEALHLWFEVDADPIILDGQRSVVMALNNITERKKAEEDLRKANRILNALSHCSEALIRASSESEYLKSICIILVKDCDYKMVWVGFAETDDAKTVLPFAQAGFEKDYLETVNISWADTERGRGPTGTCIRTGKPVVCRDMLSDPAFKPWRKEALKRGYASSIALPLIAGEKPFGSITLYSAYPDPFTGAETKLLLQLADDISYGITALRLRVANAKAENEAIQANQKISKIIESITEAYIVFDRRGRFVELNKTAEEFLGRKAEELIGGVFWKIFPKAREKEFYLHFRKVMARKKPVHFEAFSSVAQKWFETHAYYFSDGLAVYLHDITERKTAEEKLRETRDYLDSLINHANAPIIVWDQDFKIARINQAFEFISQYDSAEVVGKELTMLFPEESRDESLCKIERTLKGEHWESVEVPILCRDGSVKLFLWNSANIYKDDKVLLATIAQGQDITERKKAEEGLIKARSELEERVAQRTADLIKAQKELMSAKRLSDIGALSATVAHELRNPLGVIRAAAFNVRRKSQNPDLGKHLDRIDKKILESDQIINNLLFYSRIKSPHFERVSLPDIIKEVVADAKIKNKDSGVIVRNNSRALKSAVIEADPAQLYELFSNILNNAYEAFSGNKGMIEIKGVFDGRDNLARISFKDNGCGIDEDILQKIHDPFFTTKSQGTGLGLAVCSQVARLHGGKIEVTSCKGKGSVFTVILPIKTKPEKKE